MMAQEAAFIEEGSARWKGLPKDAPVNTAKAVAHELEDMYKQRLAWWQGPSGITLSPEYRF